MTGKFDSDLRLLRATLASIQKDKDDYYLTCNLFDAHFHLGYHLMHGGKNLQHTYDAVSNINQDIWNICTLVHRMEWLRNMAVQAQWEENNPFLWGLYASLDIEHFYVELRSILDYTAIALKGLAQKPQQVKGDSIEKLSNWLKKNPANVGRLGEEASSIVRSASWYPDIRAVRNNIVHRGSHTLVFSSPSTGILFQVFLDDWTKEIDKEVLMFNENVVDFELYAGLYFAKTFVLIEQLGDLVLSKVQQVGGTSRVRANFKGINVLEQWITRLIDKIELTQ
jgi:hypothetical protein